jgi:hypothetical protein
LIFVLRKAADFRKACEIYEKLTGDKNCPPEINLYFGCAYFFLAMYENARKAAEKGLDEEVMLSLTTRQFRSEECVANSSALPRST